MPEDENLCLSFSFGRSLFRSIILPLDCVIMSSGCGGAGGAGV